MMHLGFILSRSLRCFHKQRNCWFELFKNAQSIFAKAANHRACSFRDCILRITSRFFSEMRDGATGAAGRQHKTSKLQNCLMTGYRSGEVIMRLRGANKTRSISHYYLVYFVFYAFLAQYRVHDVPHRLTF